MFVAKFYVRSSRHPKRQIAPNFATSRDLYNRVNSQRVMINMIHLLLELLSLASPPHIAVKELMAYLRLASTTIKGHG